MLTIYGNIPIVKLILKETVVPHSSIAPSSSNTVPPDQKNTTIELPKDLYIPPEALSVFLEAFEGPLDLLLYLIKKQNIDICDIPIAEVTRQYMDYINLMQRVKLELAAEYLVMAAILAEIKSRMLIPKPKNLSENDESEVDPRAELIQRLQEYERFKKAAKDIDLLPRINRDIFPVSVSGPQAISVKKHPPVTLEDLLASLGNMLDRAEKITSHRIKRETLSVREKMVFILQHLTPNHWSTFYDMLKREEGTEGVVVTLMAILELLRQQTIEIQLSDNLSDFRCRKL